jgi:hypothetical protein
MVGLEAIQVAVGFRLAAHVTVQSWVAGVGSVFPAASVARTANV